MKYRVMRLLCMFDLPMETPEEQREYRKFRKALIKEGFTMLQYSVYVRVCPNREYAKGISKHLRTIIPAAGNIRLITVTEKQYSDMVFLVGKSTANEEKIGTQRMVVL